MKNLLTATLIAAAVCSVGCGKSKTYKSGDGSVTVEQTGDTAKYEFKTKDGKGNMTASASDAGVAIPDTFPEDVPMPKGAVAKLSMTQDKTELLHLHLKGAVAEVAKQYAADLKEAGWEIEATMNMGESSMVTAKKDGRQCAAVVMQDGYGSLIQLSVTQK